MSNKRHLEIWTACSDQQLPLHTYTELGSYQVELQVYNADGYSNIRKPG